MKRGLKGTYEAKDGGKRKVDARITPMKRGLKESRAHTEGS